MTAFVGQRNSFQPRLNKRTGHWEVSVLQHQYAETGRFPYPRLRSSIVGMDTY